MLPENILFILATNGQFPVNIVSRGREVAWAPTAVGSTIAP